MPEKPETVPSAEYFEAVRRQVLEDILNRLTTELGHPLVADVRVYKDGRHVADAGIVSVAGGDDRQHGEIRLRYRSTGVPTRYLFFADSLFKADERTPAFSGFFVRGDVQGNGEAGLRASFSAWTVKREDWQWVKWL
jgi:hypothetical protein